MMSNLKLLIPVFILSSLLLLTTSCGKPEEEVVTETFSLSQLKEAGLPFYTDTSKSGSSSSIYLYCDDSKPERADKRKQLLSELYAWIDDSAGSLSLDGKNVSGATIKTLAVEAKKEFDGVDDDDMTCPNGTGSLASGLML